MIFKNQKDKDHMIMWMQNLDVVLYLQQWNFNKKVLH